MHVQQRAGRSLVRRRSVAPRPRSRVGDKVEAGAIFRHARQSRLFHAPLLDTRCRLVGMTLWIDADAAPRDVKDICIRACERLALTTVLVANQRLQIPSGYRHLSAVRVDGGPDVADRYIEEHAVTGDVAVTADIPLAAALVSRGVVVLDPRGDEYTAESIGERLSVRNFMDGLRGTGVDTGGHAAYGPREKQAFANALDRALTRAARRR